MKFIVGPVPENTEFKPTEEGWTALREPGPLLMQLTALPIAILVILLTRLLFIFSTPVIDTEIQFTIILLTIFICMPFHEASHVLFNPQNGCSDKTWVGFWPKRLLLYAHYDGVLSRNRFLVILSAPLLVLTVLPWAIAFLLQHPWWGWSVISFCNAGLSCGDILGILLVFTQIPGNAIVRNLGWRTYWKS